MSESISSATDRVLKHLREMPEKQLHSEVIWPLLRATGAEHLQYTHGSFERGKDFLFVRRDSYGEDVLELAQVKNQEFSGNATSSNNTIGVLNQVLQCRSIEVLNPVQNLLEAPAAVTLITTYDVPDKDVAGAKPILMKLKEASCKIIGPTKIVRLIEKHMPKYFAEVATPGHGVGRALLSHLTYHQEAAAFDLSGKRLITDFFVNLGLRVTGSGLNMLERADHPLDFDTEDHIGFEHWQRFSELHAALPSPLNNVPIFEHGDRTSGELGIQIPLKRVRLGLFLEEVRKVVVGMLKQDNASGVSLGEGLRLLSEVNEVLVVAFHLIQRFIEIPRHATSPVVPQLEVPEVPPEQLLNFRANLCCVGSGGSGKTTLARITAQIALGRGLKCVYFPCTRIRSADNSLMAEMVAFIRDLDATLPKSAIENYCREAEVFILDGADEAVTYGSTLGQEIAKLAFQGAVGIRCTKKLFESVIIPRDLQTSIRYDAEERRLMLLRPLTALGFDRLRHAAPNAVKVFDALEDEYRKSAPRVFVTTREIGSLGLSSDFYRVSLLPFSDSQLDQFFRKWFNDRPAEAQAVLDYLIKQPEVREICRTPMIATIVAALHQNRARPPRSRTQVYHRRFELLLERWDQSRGVASRNLIDMEDKLTLLGRLALGAHRQHRRTFGRRDLEHFWQDTLAKRYPNISVDDILAELRFSNSVIYPAGKGEFSLGHLTYQEFLCARAIVFGQLYNELLGHFSDPWWSQVLVFFAGLAGDIESFMKTVQARYPLSTQRTHLLEQMSREAVYTGGAARDAVTDMAADHFGTIERENDDWPVESDE